MVQLSSVFGEFHLNSSLAGHCIQWRDDVCWRWKLCNHVLCCV